MTDDLERTSGRLGDELGVSDPFSDPIAADFGLRNEIFVIGDCFLEVCQPIVPVAPGQRHLDRHGPGGYMLIVQVPDADRARGDLDRLGMRVVWEGARDGIHGMHVHPRDLPGVIVSLDQATPPQSWAWGGPAWTDAAGPTTALRLLGVTVAVRDPSAASAAWAAALGAEPDGSSLLLGQDRVDFVTQSDRAGLIRVALDVPSYVSRGRDGITVDGVRFDFS